jgi:hypothetical protein
MTTLGASSPRTACARPATARVASRPACAIARADELSSLKSRRRAPSSTRHRRRQPTSRPRATAWYGSPGQSNRSCSSLGGEVRWTTRRVFFVFASSQRRVEQLEGGAARRGKGQQTNGGGKGTADQLRGKGEQVTSRRADGVEHKGVDEMHRGERERSFAPPLSFKAKMPHLLPPLLDGVFVMHSNSSEPNMLLHIVIEVTLRSETFLLPDLNCDFGSCLVFAGVVRC